MVKTYTYTARKKEDASQVVTFTLYDRRLAIQPGPGSQIERLMHPDGAGDKSAIWSKAVALLKKTRTPLFSLIDVGAGIEKDNLRLMIWSRSKDQRWVPVTVIMKHIDNPEAARAFVKELNRRKMSALQREQFLAWFRCRGYWLISGWLTALMAMLSLRFKQGKRTSQSYLISRDDHLAPERTR